MRVRVIDRELFVKRFLGAKPIITRQLDSIQCLHKYSCMRWPSPSPISEMAFDYFESSTLCLTLALLWPFRSYGPSAPITLNSGDKVGCVSPSLNQENTFQVSYLFQQGI